ncbi:MAG TPA: urate hydroxylase PuuD, partial [Casimicrobiaceae bacterium]|nr:urate hydroxylase PuuD [Casimicrobiaceae bacterium]
NSLTPPDPPKEGVKGELWAVHGGGFYHSQKYMVAPPDLPAHLHWFKWEAYSTWISGFILFVLVYWLQGDRFLVDRSVADIPVATAVMISAALLVAGWLFYDQLCKRLGFDHEATLAIALIVFFALVAFGLAHRFGGRAMYLQVGAMLGTIMVANVRFVIIPGQRNMVRAKVEGRPPDPVEGLRGKQRSVHNNYFTLPVLLTMISPHYPLLYAQRHAWLVLIAALLLAAWVRHFFNLRHRGRTVWAIPLSGAVGVLLLAVAIAPPRAPASEVPRYEEVRNIVNARCVPCHAAAPTQPGFAFAPKDVRLDTREGIRMHLAAIAQQAVFTQAMPLGNLTGMTDMERLRLGAWISAGAPER